MNRDRMDIRRGICKRTRSGRIRQVKCKDSDGNKNWAGGGKIGMNGNKEGIKGICKKD